MKVQEVILRAIAKKVTWFQAAEIAGLSSRHLRRKTSVASVAVEKALRGNVKKPGFSAVSY